MGNTIAIYCLDAKKPKCRLSAMEFVGERPASWWRSSLINCRRIGLRARRVRFPLSPLHVSALRVWPLCRAGRESTPIATFQPASQPFDSQPFRHPLAERGRSSRPQHQDCVAVCRHCLPCRNCIYKIISCNPLFADSFVYTIKVEETIRDRGLVVIVISCQHESTNRHGKDRKGNQRFRCLLCGATFAAETAKPLGEMRISMKQATTALGMLLEGMSIRAVARLTSLHPGTICDLILVVGGNCRRLLDTKIVGVPVSDVQLDEIWSFVGMKEKTRVARGESAEWGDCWTFTAIERETKLLLAHTVGQRDMATCTRFLQQLDRATSGRFQLSTDGLRSYTLNVPFVLGNRVDFAQLIKNFASTQETTRYSPAKITDCEKIPMLGNPDEDRICTSHVERMNLTIRMNLRRFTRLTNGHSKSLKHHIAMQALLFAWYNFCRVHMTIKATPAVASGVVERTWTLRELIERAAAES
jgi:IS1 family transposase/transposase-like protein